MRPVSRLKAAQSKSFTRRRQEKKVLAVGLMAVNLIAWVFVISRLTGLGFVTIDNIQVIGADPDITPAVELAALGTLDGRYLSLFSRANSFLFPHRAMVAAVMDSSPRIQSVKVYKSDLNTVTVAVNEKQPVAVVCTGLPDLSLSNVELDDSGNCYEADSTGFLFRLAVATDKHDENRYFASSLTDAASTSALVGSYATSSDEFARLQTFFDSVRLANIPAVSVLMKDRGEYEMYIANPSATIEDQSDDFVVIYFNDAGGLPSEAANLILFWQNRYDAARQSGRKFAFEYIDVRYGSNVSYREAK